VARDLGVKLIAVPPNAGVISAYGLIASDFIQFETLTRRFLLDQSAVDHVKQVFNEMKTRALERATSMKLGEVINLSFISEMRFVGQAFEVPVELSPEELSELTYEKLRQQFGEMHQKLFFFGAEEDKPIEFVSFRLGLTAPLKEIPILTESTDRQVETREIDIFESRAWRKATFMSRSNIKLGDSISGPALLDDPTSTLLVPSGWKAHRDTSDNIILTCLE
jgi:N-methylhydantoinase A